mgnify:FL=1
MTPLALACLLVAVPFALVNWVGVARADRRLVYVGKPVVLALFVVAAIALDPAEVDGTVRAWFVVGLVLSLAGDVFLMLPTERSYPVEPFLLGLVAFLLGHVAYIVGQVVDHRSWPLTIVGLIAVAAAGSWLGPRIVSHVKDVDRRMVGPVLAYIGVISTMVVTAFGRAVVIGIIGALLFFTSDGILAWNRFVKADRRLQIAVMVTYHLGQLGLLLSLLG